MLASNAWLDRSNEFFKAKLYTSLKVPKDVLMKSVGIYLKEEATRNTFTDAIEKVRDELTGVEPRQLAKDEVLALVRKVEEYKLESQKELHELVTQKRINP